MSYPPEELEWIATTAFNRAIDYYCVGDDITFARWAAKAVSIASSLQDGSSLENTLQGKIMSLQVNGGSG
jgi:hypothetical protein